MKRQCADVAHDVKRARAVAVDAVPTAMATATATAVAAACRVQRLWRRLCRLRPKNPDDPITLDPLPWLRAPDQVFRLVEDDGSVHGFLVHALAEYLLSTGQLASPLSRRVLHDVELARLDRQRQRLARTAADADSPAAESSLVLLLPRRRALERMRAIEAEKQSIMAFTTDEMLADGVQEVVAWAGCADQVGPARLLDGLERAHWPFLLDRLMTLLAFLEPLTPADHESLATLVRTLQARLDESRTSDARAATRGSAVAAVYERTHHFLEHLVDRAQCLAAYARDDPDAVARVQRDPNLAACWRHLQAEHRRTPRHYRRVECWRVRRPLPVPGRGRDRRFEDLLRIYGLDMRASDVPRRRVQTHAAPPPPPPLVSFVPLPLPPPPPPAPLAAPAGAATTVPPLFEHFDLDDLDLDDDDDEIEWADDGLVVQGLVVGVARPVAGLDDRGDTTTTSEPDDSDSDIDIDEQHDDAAARQPPPLQQPAPPVGVWLAQPQQAPSSPPPPPPAAPSC